MQENDTPDLYDLARRSVKQNYNSYNYQTTVLEKQDMHRIQRYLRTELPFVVAGKTEMTSTNNLEVKNLWWTRHW